MIKFAKYENAQEFAARQSTKQPDVRFVLLQTGAAEFIVMTEGAYKHSIVCARYENGKSVA